MGGLVQAALHEMVSRDVEEIFLKNQEREQALRNLLKTRPSESRDVSLVLCCMVRFVPFCNTPPPSPPLVKLTTHHALISLFVARFVGFVCSDGDS